MLTTDGLGGGAGPGCPGGGLSSGPPEVRRDDRPDDSWVFVSPSNQERLRRARRFLDDHAPGCEVLLVGASRSAADDLAREMAGERGATFGLHRFSFTQIMVRLAAGKLAALGLAPATSLGVEAVAARITYQARVAGKIPRFEAVSRLPGFAGAAAATLGDIRAQGVAADAVARAGPATSDLAELIDLFEREIASASIADRNLLASLARDAVVERPDFLHGCAPLLLLDVPLHTWRDAAFAAALITPGRRVLATVPSGDEKTLTVLRDLGGRGPERSTGEPPMSSRDEAETSLGDGPAASCGGSRRAEGTDSSSALRRLQENLFVDTVAAAAPLDESVRFFSAPGEARECVEIARRVLEAARSGVPFDEIAVFLRTPEVYGPFLETAFRRAGIPAFFARGTRRPDPAGRAFLALLACRAEGLSARRFAEYLSFAEVPDLGPGGTPPPPSARWIAPDEELLGAAVEAAARTQAEEGPRADPAGSGSEEGRGWSKLDTAGPDEDESSPEREESAQRPLGERGRPGGSGADRPDSFAPALEGTLRAPWRWEELLVEAAVIGGRERWRRRLTGLERELRVRIDELAAEDPESPRLSALRREVDNLGHLERFALPVIEALDQLPQGGDWGAWLDSLTLLAPRVLRHPERVLALLAELAPMSPIGPVSIEEVRAVLSERLCTIEREPPPQRYGRVFVATPEQARGRCFQVVFVPALAERVFPQRPREDPLLLDHVRRAVSSRLDTQEDRGNRERLLLRLAVGAASRQIHLSYPRLEVAEGRARVPSFYSLDVMRAIRGAIPDFEELEREASAGSNAWLSWPAPENAENAIDPVEHDLAVLGPLLREAGGRASGPGSGKGRARYLFELNEHLARSLRARWMRSDFRWRPTDGIVRASEVATLALSGQSPRERVYSASALQKFAVCPYQFFLSAIWRLEPRRDAIPLVELDPLTRGSMYHQVQAETLLALERAGALPLDPVRLAGATDVLDQTFDQLAARYREDLAPAILRVWEDETEALRADLRAWLRTMAFDESGWVPRHFEFGFGMPPDSQIDPHSRREPVTLEGGYQLRGMIDLVEERSGEMRATDHKTGRNYTKPGIRVGGGEILQPVLYALALEAVFARPVPESRLYFATSRGGFTARVVPIDEFARRYAREALEIIDRSITGCVLPAAPRAQACAWCDFRLVCGPDQEERSARKAIELTKDLTELRKLT